MKKILSNNLVFIIITLIVLLTAFVSYFYSYVGKNPFQTEEELLNPVKVSVSDCGMAYITDAGESIYLTDSDNRLTNIIYCGSDTFEYADDVFIDNDGEIYVHDRSYADNGVDIYGERIIKFSPKGKLEEVLYEYENEDFEDAVYTDSLRVIDGEVYFTEISNYGVSVKKLAEGEAVELAFGEFENTNSAIADTSFYVDDEAVHIAAALKNGDVVTLEGETATKIYNAREHDNEDYFSLISEIAYDERGSLYLNDIGRRVVYRLFPDGILYSAMSKNRFSEMNSDVFALAPLYTGLTVSNGVISVLTAEYFYDSENDEEIYLYGLAGISDISKGLFYNSSVTISTERRILTFAVYAVLILEVLILIYAAVKMIKALKGFVIEGSVKTQLVMLITALAVTVGISYIIFDSFNSRYTTESASNLCNIAYRISETIDKDELREIDNPDSYFSETYESFDESIQTVLQSDMNVENNVYCVVYKTLNDVVCEIYRYDMAHGVMYPMAGRYSGAIEERIAAENSYDVVYDFALSEGTYMYALIPVYYDNGETAAFIEAGADYSAFTSSNRELYIRVLMLAAMAVIIIMLLLSEVLCSANAFKADREARRKKEIKPPDVIRPIAFIFFVIANLSTAFLPIYGMHLWTADFPFAAEFAAAFPLSAELIVAAAASFLCGFIIRKTGIKAVCAAGGMFYILGCLASAFAPNLWALILGNSLCGAGSGCLSLALNTWAASYEDEEKQNRGFIHINAAYLAGLNCGTVIGSLIWENLGIKTVYFMGAAAAVVLIILSFVMINKIEVSEEKEEKDATGNIKELLSFSVIRYFICISVPYMICTAFLEYFFPIEAESAGLTATYISMAFLISGMISIYTGSSMAETIISKLGVRKAMILASFIYAAALIYLVVNPVIFSYYIVIGLFAVANSFGLSAQSVYFTSLPEVKRVGQSKALGVNSTVESITSACGSIIFGAVLTLGVRDGILIIAIVLGILLEIFAISGERSSSYETQDQSAAQ